MQLEGVVQKLGTKTVRQVFEHGEGTFSDDTELFNLTLYGNGDVNFKAGSIGPFSLPLDRALMIVEVVEVVENQG